MIGTIIQIAVYPALVYVLYVALREVKGLFDDIKEYDNDERETRD